MTRYPRSGRGRKWTVAELKAVGAAWLGDSLADGDGLSGTVRVSDAGAVTLHWRHAPTDWIGVAVSLAGMAIIMFGPRESA